MPRQPPAPAISTFLAGSLIPRPSASLLFTTSPFLRSNPPPPPLPPHVQLQHLLSRLLDKDPVRRPSVAEAMAHPWVRRPDRPDLLTSCDRALNRVSELLKWRLPAPSEGMVAGKGVEAGAGAGAGVSELLRCRLPAPSEGAGAGAGAGVGGPLTFTAAAAAAPGSLTALASPASVPLGGGAPSSVAHPRSSLRVVTQVCAQVWNPPPYSTLSLLGLMKREGSLIGSPPRCCCLMQAWSAIFSSYPLPCMRP